MRLEDYAHRYSRIAMERDERGVLVVTFHTEGGTFDYSMASDGTTPHAELADAFNDIASDGANRFVMRQQSRKAVDAASAGAAVASTSYEASGPAVAVSGAAARPGPGTVVALARSAPPGAKIAVL